VVHARLAAVTLGSLFALPAFADCPADLDGDGLVASGDLTVMLASWGDCPAKSACPADLDGDGAVSADDLATLLAAWGPCPAGCSGEFGWQPGFGQEAPPFAAGSIGVYDFEIFDFGNGPVLVAGGTFGSAGGVTARSVATWDGSTWSPVGSGIDGTVMALETFDDGSGPRLFAGGSFTSVGGQSAGNLAKWNGTAWEAVPGGTDSMIRDLVAFDDGTGAKLWVAGDFQNAGGLPSPAVATWDGFAWANPGGVASGYGGALHVHDGGDGPRLFLGGSVRVAGSTSSRMVVQRTATGFVPVGTNLGGSWGAGTGAVWALTSARVPKSKQSVLVAAGGFEFPGLGVAWWNGTTWSSNAQNLYGWTRTAVATYPGDSLDELYLSGPMTFTSPDGYQGIARQEAGNWLPVGGGLGLPPNSGNPPYPMPFAFKVFDDGSGPRLFAGGSFLLGDGELVLGIAAWDGTAWDRVGGGVSSGADGLYPVMARDLVETSIGGGERLVVGGGFLLVNDEVMPNLASFDGTTWSSVGGGTDGPVYAIREFDDGRGPGLFVGGLFSRVGGTGPGGIAANRIARWDGTAWSGVGGGINATVWSLAVFDDGSGPKLHAGGSFTTADGLPADRIARWNGSVWEPIPGMTGANGPVIYDLESFDDGTGPALYAAGRFESAGGVPVNMIARFRDGAWSPVGPVGAPIGIEAVLCLHVFDDGTGPALYAGGSFTQIGGVAASRLARWKDGAWTEVPGLANGSVWDLATFDDGGGPRLAVGGFFTVAGGSVADRVALRDATGWTPLDGGTNGGVYTLMTIDGPEGPTLVTGGVFTTAGAIPSVGLGWWRCGR
jgi:hypothetical protein